ncbi:MAG TPA: hypothetical protein VIY97_04880 [Candidatus Methanoperedens sp.]
MDSNQENKKIILETEPDVKPSELFVSASPHAVDKAMKTSRKIDEAKIKRLLNEISSLRGRPLAHKLAPYSD